MDIADVLDAGSTRVPLRFVVPERFFELDLAEDPESRAKRTADNLAASLRNISERQVLHLVFTQEMVVAKLREEGAVYAANCVARSETEPRRLSAALCTIVIKDADLSAQRPLGAVAGALKTPGDSREMLEPGGSGVTDRLLENGVRRKRKNRQLAELDSALSPKVSSLELDWLGYKEIPKQELIDLAARREWHYAGERLTEKSWLLSFSRESGSFPATTAGAPERVPAAVKDQPPPELRRLTKSFNRQVALAFGYGMVGMFVLTGTLISVSRDRFFLMLAVALILFALGGISAAKARVLHRQRQAVHRR
jgi:hypothetical protein